MKNSGQEPEDSVLRRGVEAEGLKAALTPCPCHHPFRQYQNIRFGQVVEFRSITEGTSLSSSLQPLHSW